ncbi:acyl-CoA dehydrogenase family protein [Actinomadura macrotermitis]|uniref:Flavin-dependent monooxygenase, oxygenase subunit HsaA n=1 Tax=Actinomadura macrotermitis TaxID=2585200 RepID=A0A7K0BZB9_9ACTN|nr:acyl-CoA dehydrogenase family protein [Actinomadura macrotermitis]MQY06535.1 Flavin-dependent monooxygenase, oxygenase subunit HsaA [Actinomadura macrotermitis]
MTRGNDLLVRARKLAPQLAERARAAEELRRLPEETVRDMADAGFLEVLVPKSRGGAELDLADLAGIARELGSGCASTGWVAAIYMLHNWVLSLFPEKAQDEVFAERPYAFAPCALAPTGRARPVDGGHRVTGRWSWGTGVMHADWVMVGAPAEAGPTVFLLPAAEVVVHDVWFTSGMRATGSNDIEVRDRFVPAHRAVPLADLVRGAAPGAASHEGAAYRRPLVPMLALAGAAPVLGAAEGLLARFQERLGERVSAYSGTRQADRTGAQIRLGRATAELAAAGLLLDDAIAALQARTGGAGLLERARARLAATQVVATARGVVNDIALAAGASAQLMHMPFQRVQRDVATISGHLAFDLDDTYALYGRVALGLDPGPATLV